MPRPLSTAVCSSLLHLSLFPLSLPFLFLLPSARCSHFSSSPLKIPSSPSISSTPFVAARLSSVGHPSKALLFPLSFPSSSRYHLLFASLSFNTTFFLPLSLTPPHVIVLPLFSQPSLKPSHLTILLTLLRCITDFSPSSPMLILSSSPLKSIAPQSHQPLSLSLPSQERFYPRTPSKHKTLSFTLSS